MYLKLGVPIQLVNDRLKKTLTKPAVLRCLGLLAEVWMAMKSTHSRIVHGHPTRRFRTVGAQIGLFTIIEIKNGVVCRLHGF